MCIGNLARGTRRSSGMTGGECGAGKTGKTRGRDHWNARHRRLGQTDNQRIKEVHREEAERETVPGAFAPHTRRTRLDSGVGSCACPLGRVGQFQWWACGRRTARYVWIEFVSNGTHERGDRVRYGLGGRSISEVGELTMERHIRRTGLREAPQSGSWELRSEI